MDRTKGVLVWTGIQQLFHPGCAYLKEKGTDAELSNTQINPDRACLACSRAYRRFRDDPESVMVRDPDGS